MTHMDPGTRLYWALVVQVDGEELGGKKHAEATTCLGYGAVSLGRNDVDDGVLGRCY